jgi:hypothetical protein
MVCWIPPLPCQQVVCSLPDEHSPGRITLLSLDVEGAVAIVDSVSGPDRCPVARKAVAVCGIRDLPGAVLIDSQANEIVALEDTGNCVFVFGEHPNLKASD